MLIGCNAIRIRTFALVSLASSSPLFFGSFISTFGLNVISMLAELLLLDVAPSIKSPRNVLSTTYLNWLSPTMWRAISHEYKLEDLPVEMPSSSQLYSNFEEHWAACKSKSTWPLARALFRTYRHQILISSALSILAAVFATSQVLVFKALLVFLYSQDSDRPHPQLSGYFIALLYILALFLWSSIAGVARRMFVEVGCSSRSVLLEAIFLKALLAHKSSLDQIGPGQLSSYGNDIERIVQASEGPASVIQLPIMMILGTLIIWQ